jgi:hypothetical protein
METPMQIIAFTKIEITGGYYDKRDQLWNPTRVENLLCKSF